MHCWIVAVKAPAELVSVGSLLPGVLCHSPQFLLPLRVSSPSLAGLSPSCDTSLSRRGAEQTDALPIVTATCSFLSALICYY